MIAVAVAVLSLALVVQGQLNPLGRFGQCIDVPTSNVSNEDLAGLWYLQFRNENPDHYVHTCQAQYEQPVGKYFNSLLYYYNKGKMVNNPQNIQYGHLKAGKYYRRITTDGEPVLIHASIVAYDPVKKYRVVYLCAEDDKANPDIFNVGIATRDMVPDNLEEVLECAKADLRKTSKHFDVPLMQVEQASCTPLDVKTY